MPSQKSRITVLPQLLCLVRTKRIAQHQIQILTSNREVAVGANFDHPDAEDLLEVSDLLLERMKYRGIDEQLIAKQAEINQRLIEKLAD